MSLFALFDYIYGQSPTYVHFWTKHSCRPFGVAQKVATRGRSFIQQEIQKMAPTTEASKASDSYTRKFGIALCCAELLGVFGALHHPTYPVRPAGALQSLQALGENHSFLNGIHAFLLMMLAIIWISLIWLSRRIGLDRPASVIAIALMTLGVLAMALAGIINGFTTPQFALAYSSLPDANGDAAVAIMKFSWAFNQALADASTIAMNMALIFYAFAFFAKGGLVRIVGIFGALCASVTIMLIATGALILDVHGFFISTALFALWGGATGGLMAFGYFDEDSAPVA